MEILSIKSGTVLTLVSIFITLTILVALVMLGRIVKKRNSGKYERNWLFYLSQFIGFGGLTFLFCRFTTFDWKRDLLTSTISAAIFTLSLYLIDQKNKKNQDKQ